MLIGEKQISQKVKKRENLKEDLGAITTMTDISTTGEIMSTGK